MSPGVGSRIRRSVLVLTAAAIVAALLVFNPLRALPDRSESADEALRAQSEITVASLSKTVEAAGEVVFEEVRDIAPRSQGTITSIIGSEPESEIARSTVLFRIDDRPTIALVGDVPMWRPMSEGDVGPDVAQLETNLVELGYDPDGVLEVDDTFTSYTADLVARWQEDIGVEPTGSVALDDLVFIPEMARVVSVSGLVGEQAGASTLLTVAPPARHVSFSVDAADLETIVVGTSVSARLPDRSSFNATVTEVQPAGSGAWVATASPDPLTDGVTLPDGLSVPVTVSWVDDVASEVTTVRANALTRLDNGTYAVEVVNEDLTSTFVEVGVGVSAGSTVEILTDLPPGTPIISP